MSSMTRSCILKCKNPGVPLHSFPKDPEKKEVWLAFVKRYINIPVERKQYHICSAHFKKELIDPSGRLRDKAIPTVFETFADVNMPKDSRARRQKIREAKRRARAAESEEARAVRLSTNAARIAKKRAEESPEERAARLASNAAHIARKRAAERRAREMEVHTLSRTAPYQQERRPKSRPVPNRGKGRRKQQRRSTYVASEVCRLQHSFDEMEVTIEDDECISVKNRLSDVDNDVKIVVERSELSAPGVDDSCDEDIYIPIIRQRSKMSELLLECEEEELEPWQKHTLHVHLKQEDDQR
ncbi:uncharacterized protein LOC131988013 [Centropristis striata]|uniref:uncharacterized protein LOC131988013 n=1 Tax=Centropristis striata TaxID=184440 RepID=UPI0027E01A61|nr:uncharacterized protein LOC131988013 [Centropristis striata]